MYQISPIVRSEDDHFNAYIWNRTKGKATLLDLQVDIYAPVEELNK
jgi:hypothetical protein